MALPAGTLLAAQGAGRLSLQPRMAQRPALPSTPAGTAQALPPGIETILSGMSRYRDLALVAGILGVLGLLIIPLPPFLLDLLLGLNIALSVLILMVVVYIASPLEISTFPTVLLVATLFRLGMNIASTRLILSEPPQGRSFMHSVRSSSAATSSLAWWCS